MRQLQPYLDKHGYVPPPITEAECAPFYGACWYLSGPPASIEAVIRTLAGCVSRQFGAASWELGVHHYSLPRADEKKVSLDFGHSSVKGVLTTDLAAGKVPWPSKQGLPWDTLASFHRGRFEVLTNTYNGPPGIRTYNGEDHYVSIHLPESRWVSKKARRTPKDWRQMLVEISLKIDELGLCLSGTFDCDAALDLDQGGIYGMVRMGSHIHAHRRVEYLDWDDAGEAARRTRVRGPAWGYYLSKSFIDRLNAVCDFKAEFSSPVQKEFGCSDEPDRHLYVDMPSGGACIFMSDDAAEWFQGRTPSWTDDEVLKVFVRTWRRFRQVGMI